MALEYSSFHVQPAAAVDRPCHNTHLLLPAAQVAKLEAQVDPSLGEETLEGLQAVARGIASGSNFEMTCSRRPRLPKCKRPHDDDFDWSRDEPKFSQKVSNLPEALCTVQCLENCQASIDAHARPAACLSGFWWGWEHMQHKTQKPSISTTYSQQSDGLSQAH